MKKYFEMKAEIIISGYIERRERNRKEIMKSGNVKAEEESVIDISRSEESNRRAASK